MAFKTFALNEILTSADVNDFLMKQSVMTFVDAAARDAALPSPTVGMVAFHENQLSVRKSTNTWETVFTSNGISWGNLQIQSRYTSLPVVRARAAASQTEPMISVEDSAGAALWQVEPSGRLRFSNGVILGHTRSSWSGYIPVIVNGSLYNIPVYA